MDESVRFDDDDVISTECCRTIGIKGTKALVEGFELTSAGEGDDNDGVEYDRNECNDESDMIEG